MKLKKLLKDIPVGDVKGSKEIEITGVSAHSKLVAPGNLFVAKKGLTSDGGKYISEAIIGGAVAVLTDMYDPSLKEVTQIIHHDVADVEALFSAQYNQFPSEQLFMVGITGTNGKTTISFLIKQLLDHFRGPCGLVGTIEYIIGEQSYRATHTTPDVTTNQKLLREMVVHHCQSAVLEVTSHGLDQGRVKNIDFDVAIFTNLSMEHLDYHETMDKYAEAKSRLFQSIDPKKVSKKKKFPKAAIVNADDPYTSNILQGCTADVITYGIDKEADVRATEIHLSGSETQFTLHYQGENYECTLPIVGRYNVYNALATIACGISQNFPLPEMITCLKSAQPVPGRLEPVPNSRDLSIYVDFAHTPDALENVLQGLQEFKKKRIITLFGCGGDRDKGKRPKMAEIAEKYSDICIVTTDNPRSEDPQTIIDEVKAGFKKKQLSKVDRREAFKKALEITEPGDILLLAGRGHEAYQKFAHHTVEFNDREVILEILESGDN